MRSYEDAIRHAHREGERFAISQFVAAMLEGNGKDDGENIQAFWDWFERLADPPIKGVCYAAGQWIRRQME